VAAIVHVMSTLVSQAANDGDLIVTENLKRILGVAVSEAPATFSPGDITNKVLHTVYMGTENSTLATQSRAEQLASEISSYHKSFAIDTVVSAVGSSESFSSRADLTLLQWRCSRDCAECRHAMSLKAAQWAKI
jgi:NAD+ synthase (glutamine-hydrolysing)